MGHETPAEPGGSASCPDPDRAGASRIRAAETKRARSRERLTAAAADTFAAHGWYQTRVEDIAAAAGLSVATTYNHFPTKYSLLTAAYAPLLQPVIRAAEADVAAAVPTAQALDDCVHLLARVARQHTAMSCAMLAAIPEIADREGYESDPDARRTRAEFDRPVVTIVEAGQRRGDLRTRLSAVDVGMLVTGTLLVRVLTRPAESAETTGDLLLQLLLHGMLV